MKYKCFIRLPNVSVIPLLERIFGDVFFFLVPKSLIWCSLASLGERIHCNDRRKT